ncbi:hypothetical protein M2298_004769 [Brevibacillus sp. 1238]|nr:hypothetical protein [Brevibacillus sp. 1238]
MSITRMHGKKVGLGSLLAGKQNGSYLIYLCNQVPAS